MTTTDAADRMRNRAGTADYATLPHTHTCGTRWSGNTTAHCGACCRTFSGPTTFDKHRAGGTCTAPGTLGMALIAGRAYEAWGYPADTTQED